MEKQSVSHLIGIGGFKRAGKDTFGHILSALTGWPCIGMSTAIAREAEKQYGIARITEDMKDQHCGSPRLGDRTYRDLLIEVGAARRTLLPTWWIDAMAQQVHEAFLKHGGAIVTGLRFPSEYVWIKQNLGITVWLARKTATSDGSATEQNQRKLADVTIFNDKGRDLLLNKAGVLLRSFEMPLVDLPHDGRTLLTVSGRTKHVPDGIELGKIAGMDGAGRIVVDDFGGREKTPAEQKSGDFLFGLTLCCNAYDKGVESGRACRGCYGQDETGNYLFRAADGTFPGLDPIVCIL